MVEVPVSLAQALHLAGWGPRQLVAAINSRLSSQGRDRYRLDPTAAYSWVKRGYCPRTPIPETAALLIPGAAFVFAPPNIFSSWIDTLTVTFDAFQLHPVVAIGEPGPALAPSAMKLR